MCVCDDTCLCLYVYLLEGVCGGGSAVVCFMWGGCVCMWVCVFVCIRASSPYRPSLRSSFQRDAGQLRATGHHLRPAAVSISHIVRRQTALPYAVVIDQDTKLFERLQTNFGRSSCVRDTGCSQGSSTPSSSAHRWSTATRCCVCAAFWRQVVFGSWCVCVCDDTRLCIYVYLLEDACGGGSVVVFSVGQACVYVGLCFCVYSSICLHVSAYGCLSFGNLLGNLDCMFCNE